MENQLQLDLLTPRVIVEKYYPHCPFEVGQILTYVAEIHPAYAYYSNGNDGEGVDEVEKSTANFRQLAWYEKREVGEMPEYVRCTEHCEAQGVYRVESWEADGVNIESDFYQSLSYEEDGLILILPATDDDYEIFKSGK